MQPLAHRTGGSALATQRFVSELLGAAEAPVSRTPSPARRAHTPDEAPTASGRPPIHPREAGYQVKGSLVRAYLGEIERLQLTSAVSARVSDGTRFMMEDPPLANQWVDALVIEEMMSAVDSLRGAEAVRGVTRSGLDKGIKPLMRPVVSGFLRLFGATPHTLMSRFSQFTRTNVRGMEFEWVKESERAGTLRLQFPRAHVPRSAFIGFESGISIICELCAVRGNIEETRISSDGSTGHIRASW
jgi:hypothetical protein